MYFVVPLTVQGAALQFTVLVESPLKMILRFLLDATYKHGQEVDEQVLVIVMKLQDPQACPAGGQACVTVHSDQAPVVIQGIDSVAFPVQGQFQLVE